MVPLRDVATGEIQILNQPVFAITPYGYMPGEASNTNFNQV
jgi:hypothetical protein